MKITFIRINKKSDEYIKEIEEYKNKIQFISRKIIPSSKMEEINIPHSDKKTETISILKKIKNTDYVILLDEIGSKIDSISFSEMIDNRVLDGVQNLVFVIGGSYGVETMIKERANYIMSFGSMIWPHRLAYVMILEQIYRAFNILYNTDYHHK